MTALLGNRLSTAILAASLIVLPLLVFLPYVRSMVVRNAVVASFVHTAVAPISGTVLELAAAGARIPEGEVAARLEDPRVDDDLLAELQARSQGQSALLDRLEKQRTALADLEHSHRETRDRYRAALERDVARRVEAVTSELAGRQARLLELRHEADRAEALHADGVLSKAQLETARAARDALESTHQSQALLLRRLEQAQDELGNGRVMVEGLEGAIQTEGDLQQMGLELRALDRSRAEAVLELEATRRRLERAEERFDHTRQAPIELPPGSVVWRSHAKTGQHVVAGEPLLSFVDCGDLLLDMRLDDSVLSLVEAGQHIRFRLFGSRRWHEAQVAMVRGSGAVMQDDVLATAGRRSGRDGQVLARIEPDEAFDQPEAFCHIGRKAYAKIDGIGLYREFLRRLFL